MPAQPRKLRGIINASLSKKVDSSRIFLVLKNYNPAFYCKIKEKLNFIAAKIIPSARNENRAKSFHRIVTIRVIKDIIPS
jgi:uncharacterized protein with ATP-grasp and redox domains